MKLLLVICATSLVLAQAATDKKIVCYWASGSVCREGHGKFKVSDIDPQLCTHLMYSFIGLSDSGEIVTLDPDCESSENNIARFNQLRKKNPKLKTMVSIGGWGEGSAKYSKAVANSSRRHKFVEGAIAFVKKYGFDGFDVDWEYPALLEGSSPADKHNFVLFLKELREHFDKEGLLLSAAVGALESVARISYDIPQISKYLDFINVMTYDFYGNYSRTGINAAIYPASSESGDAAKRNIYSVIKYWLSEGAPAEKIILGVPFYGRSFTLKNPKSNGIGASASEGAPGPYLKSKGVLSYNEICIKFKEEKWNIHFDEERRVPYAVNGNQWVSYDDEKSIKEKADLINKYNLGGGMMWSIDNDDFRGECGEKFPLLQTLNRELRNGASSATRVYRCKGTS